jgi:hypothetical protein
MHHYICFDLETAAREDVSQYIPEPEADKRLTDPVKIAADLSKKREAGVGRLSLDMNGCVIVAIGYQTELMDAPKVLLGDERAMLVALWAAAKGRTIIGYRSRTFDIPIVVQRSRFLKVPHPSWRDLTARWGKGKAIDLFDELTFDDSRQDGVIPRKLTTFCGLFDLDIPSDDSKGSDIAALVKAGDWGAIEQHCSRDVQRTMGIARSLGIVPTPAEVVAF